MRRVTGIGGVFFTARDPEGLREWYRRHLGIDVQDWGGAVIGSADPDAAMTTWSISPRGDPAFAPGTSPFMVNYRVADLPGLLAALRDEGCAVLDGTVDSEYGRFGWVIDPEGNRVELWEPPAS